MTLISITVYYYLTNINNITKIIIKTLQQILNLKQIKKFPKPQALKKLNNNNHN
jgi:hypothetical protein